MASLVILHIAAACSPAAAQPLQPDTITLRRQIDSVFAEWNTSRSPGGGVASTHGGE